MDKAFEDFFKQQFDRQENVPNPFDKEAFAQFITDQIKNAVPEQAGFDPNQLQNVANPTQQQGNKTGTYPQKNDRVFQEHNKPKHRYNVFEAHDFVIARISLEQVDDDQKTTILLNSYELFLKEAGKRSSLRIHLPKPVHPKKTKMKILDGVLEIQMMKQPAESLTEFEIYNEEEDW